MPATAVIRETLVDIFGVKSGYGKQALKPKSPQAVIRTRGLEPPSRK